MTIYVALVLIAFVQASTTSLYDCIPSPSIAVVGRNSTLVKLTTSNNVLREHLTGDEYTDCCTRKHA